MEVDTGKYTKQKIKHQPLRQVSSSACCKVTE